MSGQVKPSTFNNHMKVQMSNDDRKVRSDTPLETFGRPRKCRGREDRLGAYPRVVRLVSFERCLPDSPKSVCSL